MKHREGEHKKYENESSKKSWMKQRILTGFQILLISEFGVENLFSCNMLSKTKIIIKKSIYNKLNNIWS